jgi:CHC2 zinc finger
MRQRGASTPSESRRQLVVYLGALVGREPNGLLEVRWRRGTGMTRCVYRAAHDLAAAAATIEQLGDGTDVYVGCAPRWRHAGGLDAVRRVWVLWVDCDTPDAITALDAFRPEPAMIVRSGSGQNRHAYWTLIRGLGADDATAANRRLAHALGACSSAVISAAAILRPPGTSNFKHDPPTPVIAERLQPWRRVSSRSLIDSLPAPPTPTTRPKVANAASDDDVLRRVPPAIYVEALTGLRPGRNGKVSCPFHGEDRTPSLHVYDEPEDGWYCFGCGRGGSLFDLGAEVFGLSTRGRDFIELRSRLQATLGAWSTTVEPGQASSQITARDTHRPETSS